ncbi:MAG: SDR family NAD(P)-dependent oxidoreductase, partial [Rhodanobacter sp.]
MTPRHDRPVVLVTGAARRVGAVIARTLHAAGFDLALHYRHSAAAAGALAGELESQRADSTLLLPANLADLHDLPAMVDALLAHYGRLDALVNNASAFFATPVGSASLQQWNELFASNAQAP